MRAMLLSYKHQHMRTYESLNGTFPAYRSTSYISILFLIAPCGTAQARILVKVKLSAVLIQFSTPPALVSHSLQYGYENTPFYSVSQTVSVGKIQITISG